MSSDDAIIGKTLDGIITSWNKSAERLYGYSEAEAVGQSIEIIVPPDRRQELQKILYNIGRGERVEHLETERVPKDGQSISVSITVSPIIDDDGNVVGASTIARDITRQKRAEAELKRANRAIKAISKCNEAVIHAKEESSLLYEVCRIIVEVGGYRMAWIGYTMNDANKSIKPMANAGVTQDYVVKARVTWADTERGRGPAGTAVRTGQPCVTKHVTTDPNFAPWRNDAIKMGYNSVVGLPLLSDDKAFGVLTIYSVKPDAFDREELTLLQDLADNLTYGIISLRNSIKRVKAEADLRTAKADAELYLDLMGHDINNMSQIGLGFIELAHNTIETEGKLSLDNVELLDKAESSLKNITRLIDNVQKLRREKKGLYKPEMIDVGAMVSGVIKQFPGVPGRNVNIAYNIATHYRVQADALLSDVFINLIDNAIKHSKGDLNVKVQVGWVTYDKKPYCKVAVEDNGPGIPDTLKNSLFGRLDLGLTRPKGRGFGLYLTKTLVDDYRGKVWVEDRVPGDYTQGARFVVLLPAVEK